MIERLRTHSPAATVLVMRSAPSILDLLCASVVTGTYIAAFATLVAPAEALRGDRQKTTV